MCKVISEYRINKNGSECFRTRCLEDAIANLTALNSLRPGKYKLQYRTCQVDAHGVMLTDLSRKPLWTKWR